MKLLSKELVSLEYLEHLRRDLANARVCRFLVAYISGEGVKSIGRHLLIPALRDDRSFGIGSLSCSCRFEPLLQLQRELPEVRLKYFMDPLVKQEGEITLFHSKLVYLYLEREAKSVVYIGSQNWTRRALGAQGPRNVEASIRFESDFLPEDLDGSGTSVASEVNRHLLDAWNMPLCLPATAGNAPTFQEWFEKGCRRSASAQLKKSTILLAVRRGNAGGGDWLALQGRGIYLQVLDEEDGQQVWNSGNRLLVLVWNSDAALAAAQQPVILQCRITTSKAGRNSQLRGTNQSVAPVAGFEAVIWDDAELTAQRNSHPGKRPPVRLWSGREVQVYDFEFPTGHSDSSQLDGAVRPKYQFHLEVECVILPTTWRSSKLPDYVWSPESFSVASSPEAARVQETSGYFVEPDRERQIMACLIDVLLVQPEKAKVLPYSKADRLKIGKRISTHPLHETFLGPEFKDKKLRDEYYQRSKPGAFVADLDFQSDSATAALYDSALKDLPRLQRVFTTPLKWLVETWREAARSLHLRSSDPKQGNTEAGSPESD